VVVTVPVVVLGGGDDMGVVVEVVPIVVVGVVLVGGDDIVLIGVGLVVVVVVGMWVMVVESYPLWWGSKADTDTSTMTSFGKRGTAALL